MTARRIRAGLYEVTVRDTTWTVEERPDTFGGGSGWAWFAESEDGAYLDPLPRLRDVKAALAVAS